MKVLWSLVVALAPLAAHADTAPATPLAQSQQLLASIQSNLNYLQAHVGDCTSYGSSIQSFMIAPMGGDMANAKARLAKFEATGPNACTSRDDINKSIAAINGKLVLASTTSYQLMGMSPDQALAKALAADDSHPACPAHNPSDPTSTDQFLAYKSVKAKLVQLKGSLTALKAGVDCSR